jgi:hypothetical protein
MIAVVAPEMAGLLGDEWTARYTDEDGEPGEPGPQAGEELAEHDLVEFEEVEVGDTDSAVLIATHMDAGFPVEGRFSEDPSDGSMTLIQVRIRLWVCECTCHPSTGRIDTCEGDCHDADPVPGA